MASKGFQLGIDTLEEKKFEIMKQWAGTFKLEVFIHNFDLLPVKYCIFV